MGNKHRGIDGPVTIIAVIIVIISSISELDSSWSHTSHSRIESSFCLSLSLGQARPERDGSEIQRKGAGGGGIQETLATGTASLSLSLPIFFSLQFVSLSFRPISCSHLLSYYSDRSMFPWGFRRIGSQDQGGDAWRWLPSGFSRSSRISRRASIRLAAQVSRIPMLPLHYPFTASFSHILINM